MADLFEDTTSRDKDQLREIRDLDRLYEGRALPGRGWPWEEIVGAAVVALLIGFVYAFLFVMVPEGWSR